MPRSKSKSKKLVPLEYGKVVWCERCKGELKVGQLVGWWRVRGYGRRLRWAVYCRGCHWENVHAGEALR